METRHTRTVDVVTAGKILGIGRTSSYRLAHQNSLPVLRLGGKLRVGVGAVEEMLRSPKPPNQYERDQRRRQRRAHVEALAANGWRGKSHGAAR